MAEMADNILDHSCWKNDFHLPPIECWVTLLELVYSGRADLAEEFSDLGWAGKAAFLEAFYREVQTSPYWEELAELDCRGE